MGATESHSADDEANVLGQRSLRPLNAELRSGTRPPLCVSCKGQPLCVCVCVCTYLHKREEAHVCSLCVCKTAKVNTFYWGGLQLIIAFSRHNFPELSMSFSDPCFV